MSGLKNLDPLLHNQLRLGVMSLLIEVKDAEFGWLKDQTEATAGNLSIQIKKLSAAGYINVEKSFRGNYPLTTCSLTKAGKDAFSAYVKALSSYIGGR
jgi:DNA-binding HxlR family transcriptional regulator